MLWRMPSRKEKCRFCKRRAGVNGARGGAFAKIKCVVFALFEYGRTQNGKEKERACRHESNAEKIADDPEKPSHKKHPLAKNERMIDALMKFYTGIW